MTPEARELLRLALLRILDEQDSRFGLSEPVLAALVHRYGFQPGVDVVQVELDYLRGKSLAETITKQLSPENRHWRITATGRDLVATL